MTSPIKAIAFDLDDTLLDTSRLLIPQAWELGIQAMLNEGLNSNLDVCKKVHCVALKHLHDTDAIFREIAKNVDTRCVQQPIFLERIVRVAKTAFQRPVVPSSLPLVPGVKELLERLSLKYKLFLVTQGDPIIQMQKIKSLMIENYFVNMFILNSEDNSLSKKDSFQSIIQSENILPNQLLSVGNRLDNEICIAKKLGSMTCHIKYGEHALATPKDSFEIADYTTPYITEIERVSGL